MTTLALFRWFPSLQHPGRDEFAFPRFSGTHGSPLLSGQTLVSDPQHQIRLYRLQAHDPPPAPMQPGFLGVLIHANCTRVRRPGGSAPA